MKYSISLSTSLALLLASSAIASEDMKEIMVVTTATKTAKNIDGVTASVEVVTSEDIEKTGASTIKDVLKKLPSLTMQYGQFPHPSSKSKGSISIRGAGANSTLILIDGKRISGETENPYEMDRIPVAMIERIEIVKGSMSTLYGSEAIGGVINIITKKSDTPITSYDIKYGQNGDGDAKEKAISLSTLGKVNNLSYKAYGSIVDTSPFTIDKPYMQQAKNPINHTNVDDSVNGVSGKEAVTYVDDSTVKTFGFGLAYDVSKDLEIGFDANYFTEDREGQYIGLHPKPRPDLATTKVMVQGTPVNSIDENSRKDISLYADYILNEDVLFKAKAYISDYKKRNYTTAINNLDGIKPNGDVIPSPTNTKFSANVKTQAAELTSTIALNDSNLVTTGLEYREETRESSAINPDPSSSEFITKETKYKSIFIQDEIDFSDTLHATVGGRYESISDFDSKATFQAGIIKNITQAVNARVNFATGYRAPDVAEMYVVAPYFKDARRFGADVIFGPKTTAYDLKPESSQTIEAALSYNTNKLQTELVLFNTIIEDKIALVAKNTNQANKYYTSENIDEVTINGAEASFNYMFNSAFDLGLNATFLKTEDETTSKELIFTPKTSAAFLANYALNDKLSSSLILRYIGEQYTDAQNTQSVDEYAIADITANYSFSEQVQLYVGVNNIADETVDELLGSNVGRYYFAGIRGSF